MFKSNTLVKMTKFNSIETNYQNVNIWTQDWDQFLSLCFFQMWTWDGNCTYHQEWLKAQTSKATALGLKVQRLQKNLICFKPKATKA